MKNEIVIDCPNCAVRVKSLANSWIGDGQQEAYFLVECSSCKAPLFGKSYVIQDSFNNWGWSPAERLWPAPTASEISAAVPSAARRDIRDAQKCFSHGVYSAAVVLCGRALERLIKEKSNINMIGKGLADLKQKGVIDDRLFAWAEALRKERNIGAHASSEDTTKENAQDVIDFTIAIFDYIYTLSEKYEKYMVRKSMPLQ